MGQGIVNTAPKLTVGCRLCQGEIQKGEKCFAWISHIERPRWAVGRTQPGRSPMLSSGVRWFIHHHCLLGGLENLAAAVVIRCNSCNGESDELIYVRKRSGLMKVCEDCATRFPITCSYCSHRVEATDASMSLTPFSKSFTWNREDAETAHGVVCDGCAISYRLDTVNTRRSAHKASRREWATIRAAADDVMEWADES